MDPQGHRACHLQFITLMCATTVAMQGHGDHDSALLTTIGLHSWCHQQESLQMIKHCFPSCILN